MGGSKTIAANSTRMAVRAASLFAKRTKRERHCEPQVLRGRPSHYCFSPLTRVHIRLYRRIRSYSKTAIPAAKDKLVPKPKRTRHFDMTKPAFHTFDAANRASEDTR